MRSSLSDPASPSTLNSQEVAVSLMLAERGVRVGVVERDDGRLYAVEGRRGVVHMESRCDAERLFAYKSDGMNVGPPGALSGVGVVPPGQTGALSSLSGQTIYRRYVCLPDTVDPRGVKGK